MKNKIKTLIFLLAIVLLLSAPTTVMADALHQIDGQTINGDQLIIGDSFVLKSGQTLNGDLVIIGGDGHIESGASINGDIAVLGGNLDLYGVVDGTVAAIGANVSLYKGALISSDLINLGGTISGIENATIRGGVQTFTPRTLLFNKDMFRVQNFPGPNNYHNFGTWLISLLGQAMEILAMAVLAVIVLLVMPKLTKNVADTATDQPWISGGAGLLTFLASPLVLLILVITIILIPVAILAILALALAVVYGWIAIGYEIGKRMAVLFKTNWADAVSGGLGTLVLGIVSALLGFIPCLGIVIQFLIACAGLGAVILSGFGTRPSTFQKPSRSATGETLPNPSPAPNRDVDIKPPSDAS